MNTWKLTARKLCRKPDMVLDDARTGGTPLGVQVILYPRMTVNMTGGAYILNDPLHPGALQPYQFNFDKDAGFVCVYGLPGGGANYPSSPNELSTAAQSEWTASATEWPFTERTIVPMAPASIPYSVYRKNLVTGKQMVWGTSSPKDPHRMATFEDNNGNQADVMPVMVFDGYYNVCLDVMIPDLKVELVRSTDTICTIRVTRSHAVPANSEFSDIAMTWTDDIDSLPAGVLAVYADPDDAGNSDKVYMDCVPGVYKLGVEAVYQSTPRDWPGSRVNAVIEIK